MKEYQYKIRAHHGMCLAFFKGKGYSGEFTEHMAEVKNMLDKNPVICIIDETDIICGACPNNRVGKCTAAEKVAEYDRQVLMRCRLSKGQTLSFFEFRKLVYDNILLPGKREEICGDCQWNPLCVFKNEDDFKCRLSGGIEACNDD